MRGIRQSARGLTLLLATTALAAPALAQEASIVPFPVRAFADENGVDLLSGVMTVYSPAIRIGDGEMGLSYVRAVRGPMFRDEMMGTISVDYETSNYMVAIAGKSEAFSLSGGIFTPVEQNGSSLVLNGSTYTYRRSDGTVATFEVASYNAGNAMGTSISTLTYPSGRTLTYHYVTASYVDGGGATVTGRRLQSVTTNSGYHMKLSYHSDNFAYGETGLWARTSKVKGLNSSTDSCSVTAYSCPQTGRPELTIPLPTTGGTSVQTYIDSENRTTTYTLTGPLGAKNVTAIRLPGSTADDISVTYTSGRVTSITRFGITTAYSASDAGNVRTVTVTRPGGATRVATFDIAKSVMLSDRDELNRTTSYLYDTNNRVTRVTRPEGNYTQLTYDGRGNVTEARQVAKASSGLGDITISASYDATCTVAVKCNSPNSVTDARGNTTNYSYDGTHGGVLAITAPAPTGGSPRPETRISYTRLDANGAPSATGIFRPTGSSTCQTGSAPACVGTSDEVKTAIAYGYGLVPSSVSKGAGDNSLTATSSMTYDTVGNLLTVDGPLAGTADTSRYRYNLNRELVGVVGPDPDGAGPLKHRATQNSYTAAGQLHVVHIGTVTDQSDGAWASFSIAQTSFANFDQNGRVLRSHRVSGGNYYEVEDYLYDQRGRPYCTITQMNPATWGPYASSCSPIQTNGPHGPDRVRKVTYDAAGQVGEIRVRVGTAAEAVDKSATYTSNGQLATLKDGENNLTTYEYDGQDRLSKTYYPNKSKGNAASNPDDYEQLTYDAAGNVTAFRLRNGHVLTAGYDNLGRRVAYGGSTIADRTYSYDLLGRLTGSAFVSGGPGYSATYDALGRNLTQAGAQGTVASEWDTAGRRTRLTYPGGGLYVDYDYLVTGEMTKIRENGATSGIGVLATFAYDDLGRRTSLTFGNGNVTSYSHDPASRLTGLTQDLAGTAQDLTIGTIGYNPASQIVSQVRSNDSFAWTGSVPVSRPYTSNGLNQLTQSGSITPAYDELGNLKSAGSTIYSYNDENLLTSATNGASLAYDVLGRLHQINGPSSATRFAYDGVAMVAEFNASNTLLRRYVHGPSTDEPLVQYEGSDTATRRFLHADERGSIVAVSDASGNSFAANSYDEYGIQGAANYGRFQYTGQAWLPELGMYYYKARIYSPTLGRFLQTDPIGYGDGMNIYAYVGNDPVNFKDPLGLYQLCGTFDNGDGYVWWNDEGDGGVALGTRSFRCIAIGMENYFKENSLMTVLGVDEGLIDEVAQVITDIYCGIPAFGGNFTANGYQGLGGGVSGDAAFDPQTGRLGASGGLNVGVGRGFSVDGSNSITAGRSVPDGWSGSLGANASASYAGRRVGVAATIIDTNGYNPHFNGVNTGRSTSIIPQGNANLTVRGGWGGQVVPAC